MPRFREFKDPDRERARLRGEAIGRRDTQKAGKRLANKTTIIKTGRPAPKHPAAAIGKCRFGSCWRKQGHPGAHRFKH